MHSTANHSPFIPFNRTISPHRNQRNLVTTVLGCIHDPPHRLGSARFTRSIPHELNVADSLNVTQALSSPPSPAPSLTRNSKCSSEQKIAFPIQHAAFGNFRRLVSWHITGVITYPDVVFLSHLQEIVTYCRWLALVFGYTPTLGCCSGRKRDEVQETEN